MAVDPAVAALETEARAYCESTSINPDQMIGLAPNQTPMWQNAAKSLLQLKWQLQALGVSVP